MNPSTKLLLDKFHRLFAEQSAHLVRRFADLAAPIATAPAPSAATSVTTAPAPSTASCITLHAPPRADGCKPKAALAPPARASASTGPTTALTPAPSAPPASPTAATRTPRAISLELAVPPHLTNSDPHEWIHSPRVFSAGPDNNERTDHGLPRNADIQIHHHHASSLLPLFEYRGARIPITEQFHDTTSAIVSIVVDLNVMSLNGRNDAIETEDEIDSLQSSRNPTPRGSSFNHTDSYSMVGRRSNFAGNAFGLCTGATPKPSNYEEDAQGKANKYGQYPDLDFSIFDLAAATMPSTERPTPFTKLPPTKCSMQVRNNTSCSSLLLTSPIALASSLPTPTAALMTVAPFRASTTASTAGVHFSSNIIDTQGLAAPIPLTVAFVDVIGPVKHPPVYVLVVANTPVSASLDTKWVLDKVPHKKLWPPPVQCEMQGDGVQMVLCSSR